MLSVCVDTVLDTIKLIPFLFLTYLAMEYLEHRTGNKTKMMIKKAGKFGPVVGGVLGLLPQCGFSAAASNFYAGRVITLGTLMAIYLSTSDEMLPVLISEQAPLILMGNILLAKMLIGITVGLIIDLLYKKDINEHIHDLCEHDHCHCDKGILKSAFNHTLKITFFIFVISLILNVVIMFVGEDSLEGLLSGNLIWGPVFAAFVGLVPNCASSVAITQLYLKDAISLGGMMAGLLSNAGVGLIVLFKINDDKKENLKITGLLLVDGIVAGIIIDFCFR